MVIDGLQSVSIEDFTQWIKDNEQYTWSHSDNGGFAKNGIALVKYIRPSIDTRDMQVFAIYFDEIFIRSGDEPFSAKQVTILDQIDAILRKRIVKTEKAIEKIRKK